MREEQETSRKIRTAEQGVRRCEPSDGKYRFIIDIQLCLTPVGAHADPGDGSHGRDPSGPVATRCLRGWRRL